MNFNQIITQAEGVMQKKYNRSVWCPTCNQAKVIPGEKCINCKFKYKKPEPNKPYTSLDFYQDMQRFIDGKPLC